MVTLDSTSGTSSVTLSNGDLTATGSFSVDRGTNLTWLMGRRYSTNTHLSSDQVVWEVTVDATPFPNSGLSVGVITDATKDLAGGGYNPGQGSHWLGSSPSSSTETIMENPVVGSLNEYTVAISELTAGDVIMIAMSEFKLDFYLGGSLLTSTNITALESDTYRAVLWVGNGTQATINFGATPFTQAVPVGFEAWENPALIQSSMVRSTGKWFFELTPGALIDQNVIGIGLDGGTAQPGTTTTSTGFRVNESAGLDGDVQVETVLQGEDLPSLGGFPILILVDLDAGTFTVDNSFSGTIGPFSITTGINYRAQYLSAPPGSVGTVDFLMSALLPPPDYLAWDSIVIPTTVVPVDDLDCEGFDADRLQCGPDVAPELPCVEFTTDLTTVSASLVIEPTVTCQPYTLELAPSTVDINDQYQIVIHTMGEATITSPHGDFLLREDISYEFDPLITELVSFGGSNTLSVSGLVSQLGPVVVQSPIVRDGVIIQQVGELYANMTLVNNVVTANEDTPLCGTVLVNYRPVNEIRYTYASKPVAGEYGYLINLDCNATEVFCVRVGLD